MAEKNNNSMEINNTAEATEVAEVKKPIGAKIKEGASKVWSVVKTPLAIGGAMLLGAGIALAGAQYEHAMNDSYDPGFDPEPDCDPEPVEGTYKEVPESE